MLSAIDLNAARRTTQFKDFKRGNLAILTPNLLRDPEAWFFDLESLFCSQNVHESDYVSCLLACCSTDLRQDLSIKSNQDPSIMDSYVSLRHSISNTYGPAYPLVYYTRQLLKQPSAPMTVVNYLSYIDSLRRKYERAYERYPNCDHKPLPTLDNDLCFRALVDFILPFAPQFASALQLFYKKCSRNFDKVRTYIQQASTEHVELVQQAKSVVGYTLSHPSSQVNANIIATIKRPSNQQTNTQFLNIKTQIPNQNQNRQSNYPNSRFVNSNNRRSYNNFNSRAHFHTQQNKSPRYCQRCKSYGHTQNLCPVSLQLNSRTYNSYNKQQTQYKPNNNFSNNQPNHNNNYKNNLNTNNYNNRSRGSRGFQSFNNRSSFRGRFSRPFRHNNQRFVRFSNTVDTLKEEQQDTSTFNNPNNNSDDCDNYNYDESDFHNVNPNLIPIDESNNISE